MALLGRRDVLSMFCAMGRVVEFVFMVHGEKSYGASLLRCFSFSVCVRLLCVRKTPFNINYKMF